MSEFHLYAWQESVLEAVERHEEISGRESMQLLDNYQRNKEISISVKFPKGSGHTTFASYLAFTFPSVLVYSDQDHLKELELSLRDFNCSDDQRPKFQSHVNCISFFQIHHHLITNNPRRGNVQDMYNLSNKFQDQTRIVVVDMALRIQECHPEIIDWLFQISTGSVILLG